MLRITRFCENNGMKITNKFFFKDVAKMDLKSPSGDAKNEVGATPW